MKVVPGRIKNVARTWRKLNLPQYAARASTLDDVPTVLDDLIATRVICTNTSDLSRVWELLTALPDWKEGLEPVLALEPQSQRDYCTEPKPTGYRARHLNVRTAVNDGLTRTLVTCEVQVRTLLQDSWGELTHEDTYKPGSQASQLVMTLARRMADLLATLDEIAEDLRIELDRFADDALESIASSDAIVSPEAKAVLEPLEVAARAYLLHRTAELTGPLDLATLAWEMQREFGQEIVGTWFGHGTFAKLLEAANPDIRVSTTPPAYVFPQGYQWTDASAASVFEGRLGHLPVLVSFLKTIDRSFPLYSPARWRQTFDALSAATQTFPADTPFDLRALNELTRRARDISIENGSAVSRSALTYVAKGIWYIGALHENMSSDDCDRLFLKTLLGRFGEAVVVSDAAMDELKMWLGIGSDK